jgi:hypothetical protein
MPDQLAEDLVRTINEMRRQETSIRERMTEEAALRAKFQSDIDRFRTLRGSGGAGQGPSPTTAASL